MRKKVIFLDQGETLGGAERYLLDFLNSLSVAEKRQICPMIFSAATKKYASYLRGGIKLKKFHFSSFKGNFLVRGFRLFQLLVASKKLALALKREQPDLVVANTPRSILTFFFARKFFFLKKKFIFIVHDYTIPIFLLRAVSRIAASIIVVSVSARNFIKKNIDRQNHYKVKIIDNGIDFRTLPAAKVSTKITKIVLLGRMDPRKGQHFLLEVARQMIDSDPQLRFFLVGSPYSYDKATVKYAKKITQRAQKLKLANFQMLPEVLEPFRIMREGDLVLSLPTEDETFGRVVSEGLSVGSFVLAFDRSGPREILNNFAKFCSLSTKPNPLLIEPNSIEDIISKIKFFASRPDLVKLISQQGRKFTEKNYNLRETKKQFLKVLLED